MSIDIFEGWNEELQAALYDGLDEDIGVVTEVLDRAEQGTLGRAVEKGEFTDDEVADIIRAVPQHLTGLNFMSALVSTGFQWTAQNQPGAGAAYQPISNSGNILKKYSAGTASTNNVSGGADEVFSFQQGINAGGSATINLRAMTNLLGISAVAIARFKSYQIRLLSAADDATISPAPNAASTCYITNMTNIATPAPLDFAMGTLLNTIIVVNASTNAINSASISTAGSGYLPSATFVVAPLQAAGNGGVISVTTNSNGIPTSLSVLAGGANYINGTYNTVVLGCYLLDTGDAHVSVNISNTGVPLSATSCNIEVVNNDASHAITPEFDFIGATT